MKGSVQWNPAIEKIPTSSGCQTLNRYISMPVLNTFSYWGSFEVLVITDFVVNSEICRKCANLNIFPIHS